MRWVVREVKVKLSKGKEKQPRALLVTLWKEYGIGSPRQVFRMNQPRLTPQPPRAPPSYPMSLCPCGSNKFCFSASSEHWTHKPSPPGINLGSPCSRNPFSERGEEGGILKKGAIASSHCCARCRRAGGRAGNPTFCCLQRSLNSASSLGYCSFPDFACIILRGNKQDLINPTKHYTGKAIIPTMCNNPSVGKIIH